MSPDQLTQLREDVARIIDPEAWDEISADDNEEAAAIFAEAWEVALAKADAILAMIEAAPVLSTLPVGGDMASVAEREGIDTSRGERW